MSKELFRAHFNLSPDCVLDSFILLKFDLLSHPSVVDLSVWDSTQLRGMVLSSMMSTHGLMVEAINNRKVRVVRK